MNLWKIKINYLFSPIINKLNKFYIRNQIAYKNKD